MDIKQEYREETNEDVYLQNAADVLGASYKDEYVHWLEKRVEKLYTEGEIDDSFHSGVKCGKELRQ